MIRLNNILYCSILIFFSCKHNAEVTPQSQSFKIVVPSNFSQITQPASNPATEKGIELGRKLFYDPILSGDNTISCFSCHQQTNGFSDKQHRFSSGINQKQLLRNTPPLFNLAWANGYFWDGGAKNLESQVFAPLQSPDEMDQDLKELVAELKNDSHYPTLFKEAFDTDTISSALIAKALAQFERTLISANSKYDHWIRKESNIELDTLEMQGFNIFKLKCASCHQPDFFTDFDYHNNGLDSTFIDESHENLYKGRYRISGKSEDIGKYKTPSLRNVALTAPYMHDGRFGTLEEVINHYSEGIISSATLDPQLQNNFNFTKAEKDALIAFMQALTDKVFTVDLELSAP